MFYICMGDSFWVEPLISVGLIGKIDLSLLAQVQTPLLNQFIYRHDYKDNHDVFQTN